VFCLHSAGAVLLNISSIAGHETTGFEKHTPTNLYLGTNLYLRKFFLHSVKCQDSRMQEASIYSLVISAKTFEGTDVFQVQYCWGMVNKTSCTMPEIGEMAGKTAPAKCRKHTSHVMSNLIAQTFVFE